LFFFLPFVVIGGAAAYVWFSGALVGPGTLSVAAGSGGSPLVARFTVNGITGQTPANITLGEGTYTVVFTQLQWYATPPSDPVTVLTGITVYAYGQYNPVVDYVAVTDSGFNATRISALHGVTPVTWVNQSQSTVTLLSSSFAQTNILPGRSFTHVFASTGAYTVLLQGTTTSVVIAVQ
jgi:plastocyanin